MTAKCTYTLQCNATFPPKIAPSHGGSGPHLMYGSLGTPESSTQMTSQSVQPFLQGSLVYNRLTYRPTDHTTRSETIGRIYVRSTAMRPNKYKVQTFEMCKNSAVKSD